MNGQIFVFLVIHNQVPVRNFKTHKKSDIHKTHTQTEEIKRKKCRCTHKHTKKEEKKTPIQKQKKKNACTLKHKKHAQIKNISNRQYNLCINVPTRLIFPVVEISSTQVIPRGRAA